MAFVLPDLPYAFDALEPIIDAKTMEIHHGRHHAAYVANLNKAVENYPEWAEKSIEDVIIHLNEVPEAIRTAVRNNGGGHYNHSLFWKMMAPVGQTKPSAFLLAKIDESFGSFDEFKKQFAAAATSRFGSGWGRAPAGGSRCARTAARCSYTATSCTAVCVLRIQRRLSLRRIRTLRTIPATAVRAARRRPVTTRVPQARAQAVTTDSSSIGCSTAVIRGIDRKKRTTIRRSLFYAFSGRVFRICESSSRKKGKSTIPAIPNVQ